MTAVPTRDIAEPLRVERNGSEDAEQAVLAAMLLDEDAVALAREKGLAADDFVRGSHRRIFAAMVSVAARGALVDPIALAEELDRRGELEASGGREYISVLLDAIPTTANAAYYVDIVLEHAYTRALAHRLEQDAQLLRSGGTPGPLIAERLRRSLDVSGPLGREQSLPAAVCAIDLRADTAPIRWAVPELFPAGEIGMLVGDGGSFKTSAGIALVGAIAGGYSVWGRFATSRAPVLFVSAEDPEGVIQMRLEAFIAGHDWDRDRVLENVHVIAAPDANVVDARWQTHLRRQVERLGAAMVLLDPWADLLAAKDENSNSDVRPVVKYLRALGRDTGAAVSIVHHSGKASADRRTIDRIRGASALPSAARSILFFEYGPLGVVVEHLKSSRAPRLDAFVVARTIDADPENRAIWRSARLGVQAARTAALSRAEEFVLAQVAASPRQYGSTELRRMALDGAGIRNDDVARAIETLQTAGRIAFAAGARGKRCWYAVTLSNPSGQGGNSTLSTLSSTLPAGSPDPVRDPVPLQGTDRVAAGQGPVDRVEDDPANSLFDEEGAA